MHKHLLVAFNQLLLLALFSSTISAQENTFVEADGYRVFYSIFNSTFIKPEIAQAAGLVRDKKRTLLNLVVTKIDVDGQSLGVPATIDARASNLMQQQQRLKFTEIKEPGTVYYLAPIRHSQEEVFNFSIDVTPIGATKPITIKFSKKLWVD
jgi:hypothetical protein